LIKIEALKNIFLIINTLNIFAVLDINSSIPDKSPKNYIENG
jgi:hypothetical protein